MFNLKPKGVFTRNLRSWFAEQAFTAGEFSPVNGANFSLAIFANITSPGKDMYVTDTSVTIGGNSGGTVGWEKGNNGIFCGNGSSIRAGAPNPQMSVNLDARVARPSTVFNLFGIPSGTAIIASGDPLYIIPPGYALWFAPGVAGIQINATIWGVFV